MIAMLKPARRLQVVLTGSLRRLRPSLSLFTLLILFPSIAFAQSPFGTGFTAMQTLFTGTVVKVASLIAIVVGGYQFAYGEPGAKKIAWCLGGARRLLRRDRRQSMEMPGRLTGFAGIPAATIR